MTRRLALVALAGGLGGCGAGLTAGLTVAGDLALRALELDKALIDLRNARQAARPPPAPAGVENE